MISIKVVNIQYYESNIYVTWYIQVSTDLRISHRQMAKLEKINNTSISVSSAGQHNNIHDNCTAVSIASTSGLF